jgi:hypothetical protein
VPVLKEKRVWELRGRLVPVLREKEGAREAKSQTSARAQGKRGSTGTKEVD